MTPEERGELEVILGHHFQRPEELDRALTHRSHRQSSQGTDNERLEFLGDRVLGLVASEHLCRSFPDWDSGQLSKGLARGERHFSACGGEEIETWALSSSGAGRGKPAAAIRRGCSPTLTKRFSRRFIWMLACGCCFILAAHVSDPCYRAMEKDSERADHKSALQEWLQQRARSPVEYRIRSESGPEHQKVFEVEVWHGGERLSTSTGRSKKEAEQQAASAALESRDIPRPL